MKEPVAIGDVVTVRDAKQNTYRNAYGADALQPRVVVRDDHGTGRRRLHLDGPPTLLWVGDARIVMRKRERERMEADKAKRAS